MQATNEELETNNEELQATNEELQTTNDELTSRTAELQELARQNRIDQIQQSLLMERFPNYVMVLNAGNLTVLTVNPAYKQWLAHREVIGLPIGDVFAGRDLGELMELLRKVVRDAQTIKTDPLLVSIADHTNGRRRSYTQSSRLPTRIAPTSTGYFFTVKRPGKQESEDV